MKFEWNIDKNASNVIKHGISFEDAKELWSDPSRVEIQASFPDENRFVIIGKIGTKTWTAIYTIRGKSIRIISVRRSRDREVLLYGQNQGCQDSKRV